MRLQPTRNYVWITTEAEKVTKGGIHLPDNAQAGAIANVGIVKEIGPGFLSPETGLVVRPCLVKKGDRVVFINYGAQKVNIDSKDYLVVEDTHITAIISE